MNKPETRQEARPILFHDIDGVIFGYYGPAGHLQPRPGLADWVQWVHEHFTVIWFSVRRETQVRELMQSLCLEKFGKVCVAQWNTYADKEPWLAVEVKKLNGRPWLWIDDHIAVRAGWSSWDCLQRIAFMCARMGRMNLLN